MATFYTTFYNSILIKTFWGEYILPFLYLLLLLSFSNPTPSSYSPSSTPPPSSTPSHPLTPTPPPSPPAAAPPPFEG